MSDLSLTPVSILDAWELITVPFGAADVNDVVFGGACFVYGVSLVNTSATAAAEVQLLNGGSGSVSVLDYSLTTGPAGAGVGESVRDMWPLPGWPFPAGVYINVVAGAVRGALAVGIPPS